MTMSDLGIILAAQASALAAAGLACLLVGAVLHRAAIADAARRALGHLVDWVLLVVTVAALARPAAAAAPVSATPRHSHRRGGA